MNYKVAMERVSSAGCRAILVFSKTAELGKVKTRLRPTLNEEECLRLHLAMLQDTLDCCGSVAAETVLYLTTPSHQPFPVPVRYQTQGDLGARMKNAFQENLGPFESVVIVGTDAPALTPSILEEAFHATESHDLVLGPSEDGGYYLIGLKQIISDIFENIPWSTPSVLPFTLDRMAQHSVHLLPRLYDIDLPQDLARLEADLNSGLISGASNTREMLKKTQRH